MSMSKIYTLTLVLMGLYWLNGLQAQHQSITEYLEECERKYGSDANLVNGEKYFYPYGRADGDPFLYSEPRQAVIRVHEKEFPGQMVKYDLYNQLVILDFNDIYGGVSSLVLRNEWVESFRFESNLFRRMEGPEGEEAFFQVVVDGPISIVYSWMPLARVLVTGVTSLGVFFTYRLAHQ